MASQSKNAFFSSYFFNFHDFFLSKSIFDGIMSNVGARGALNKHQKVVYTFQSKKSFRSYDIPNTKITAIWYWTDRASIKILQHALSWTRNLSSSFSWTFPHTTIELYTELSIEIQIELPIELSF